VCLASIDAANSSSVNVGCVISKKEYSAAPWAVGHISTWRRILMEFWVYNWAIEHGTFREEQSLISEK